ncbi:uncharacterized protein AKAME5_001252600 [Lates japonicus]|uniref:Uncharacterized protein n=1 Tax=Lates japonicus TaxID=270547 RepID=A0AAD3MVT2_LATJO|nr:uncharacterized protein AKAME5_001252600 [Lates japonicus]
MRIFLKLGDLTPAPELVGHGAVVVAILIDRDYLSPSEESTKDALRSVFAEEKASEVWDQIDLCLTRCRINLKNKDEQRSDIKWIERKLSAALIKLKNSMLFTRATWRHYSKSTGK